MKPPTRVRFLVVGGGIGGLTAALALARAGRRVHLLEAARQFGEIGAGIQLGPNATLMLDRLGLLPSVRECSFLPRALVAMDALSGERITAVDLGRPFVEHYGAPYVVLHRSDLHSLLLDACRREDRITLEVDRKATHVDEAEDGALVRCEDGATYACAALIGADGLKSIVRRLMSDDELVVSDYVAYRGTISIESAHLHAGRDSMAYWWGPELHLVQYKVRGGELYNQVGVFRSTTPGAGGDASPPAHEVDAHFSACCEPVRRGAALLDRAMRWPMIDRDPIGNWTRNRITLLGDAAHPMLQYLAQGGCQAIEDALCLADMVAEHDDVGAAFLAYQAIRIPRTARVQSIARTFGEMCHVDGIGIPLRNRLLSMHAPDDYGPLDWLYKVDVPDRGRQAIAS